jgi:hypothetical protein
MINLPTETTRFYRAIFVIMNWAAVSDPYIKDGIINEQEFERLYQEMERVEREKNILCVSNYIFSAWAVKI